MRLLTRARPQLGEAQLVELAPMVERSFRPRAHHHLERLFHPLAAVVAPEPETDEFVLVEVRPVSDADVDAPAREVVEQGQFGRQPDRMAQGELDHGEAETDPRRAGGDDARDGDRVAVDALAREVVLGEPDYVE